MIFDIHNPLCPLGLMSGRAQARRAWRLPLIRLGNCRDGGQLLPASALSRHWQVVATCPTSSFAKQLRVGMLGCFCGEFEKV